jgi:hypothetical protein
VADEFAIPEESDVAKSKDCCSALVGSWYLEVFARLACKEDCKAGKLGNCDEELRDWKKDRPRVGLGIFIATI